MRPLFTGLLLVLAAPLHAADAKLELKKGDHICVIGNTLADRMQHDGWLETYIQARFPKHELVFRELGFSGDELTIRLRSQSFGTPDQWLAGKAPCPEPQKLVSRIGVRDNRFELTETRADVVFAFFGYNESWAGEAGLPKFKEDLAAFIKHTLAQNYNGKGSPRLVLFSPTAFEDLTDVDGNLPDGKETNKRLELYTTAMEEVAKANKVPFVDLFHHIQIMNGIQKAARGKALGSRDNDRLTINGIHLNTMGNAIVAAEIDRTLFGPAPKHDEQVLQKLRQAVQDKNFYWFNRYRVLDGFNVYGGRAFEKYADKQSNYEDQQRELEIFDVKTSNRDKRIWAVAQGGDLKIDDSNCPPLIPVKTNKPGPGPGGAHVFLSGEEAISKMTIGKGLKVSLFASEADFPGILEKPVQMQFDPQGRLWVAVWPSYPRWKPTEELMDKLVIFEDTNNDGKADKYTIFADKLNCPTGFEFYNGGVLLAQAPDLIFLKDTDGDGKADVRQRVVHGLDSADSHHTANSFTLDPGGALYFQEGTFHHSQTETPWGPVRRVANGAVFRYEPRAQKFDVYVTTGFANPHGHVWDRWGNDIVYDGTGAQPYHGALFSGHMEFPSKHPKPPQVYQQRTRPCPGVEILTSNHFPDDFRGNLLVGNVIGFQGILRYRPTEKDSSLGASELEPIVSSSDPNFRPSDLKTGPDGALWFIDWQNPIIGHLQHAIRDPSRDRTHGRIYRVTYDGRPLNKPTKIAGEPIEKLLALLKDPQDRVRYWTRIELGSRKTDEVIAAAKKWIDTLNPKDEEYEHHVLEGLWLHQSHNVVDTALLSRVLSSKDHRARAAAARVLCYWRDRVPDALEMFKKLAADESGRVRLEAVRAASFFTEPEAIEIVLIADEKPSDQYLAFVRTETLKTLNPIVQKMIASGKEIKFTTTAGARYFLKNVNTDDLLKMKRTQGVFLELLFRKGVRDEFRREALTGLAKLENKPEMRVLLDAIRGHDDAGDQEESVAFDLIRLLGARNASELVAVRADLEKLAATGRQPVTRQLGYVSLIAADGSIEKAWTMASKSTGGLLDLVHAMPLVRDPDQRMALYPKVEPLLVALPKELSSGASSKSTMGRYVRVELPGKNKTLTLAEVEVFSNGKNVARQGKASQSSTSHGGSADKAIDGNMVGSFSGGGQTHTAENEMNPWWEVDLKAEFPIESIVVYNRTDEILGKRLNNFTLKVLAADKKTVVFQRQKQPAPDRKVAFEVGGTSPDRAVRHAAMLALTSVRGKEEETFKSLAKFVKDDADRDAAINAIERIPARDWPKDEAKPLLETILAYIKKIPATERTTESALDAMQLAESLTAMLPREDAARIRKELGELGVRVLRVGTVLEQMRYDRERLVVRAGKPFEIVLENTDAMPHNLVLIQPGSLEEVGKLAEEQATQPGAAARQYVPQSPKVWGKSRLLQPRESQRIALTAPAKPGVYPYVCTYPGHWQRMHGALYVVADLDEYLADPEAYLVKNPLAIQDTLLKDNRPRKEWKFEELVADVEKMDHGRSFTNGKQMFQVATCTACHKLNNVGTEIGPDLTKPDPKFKHSDILKEILEPSFKINEKFQSYKLELDSGKTITGLIVEEKNGIVKVVDNPQAKDIKPLELKASSIVERQKSPVSLMPKGLLDKLTKEEILDLVAYVLAKGDAKHKLFQGGHDHEHKH